MNSFYDAVSGVRTGKTVRFRNDRGDDVELAVHEIAAPLEAVDSPERARPRSCTRSPATRRSRSRSRRRRSSPIRSRPWKGPTRASTRSSRRRSRSSARSWPTRSRPAPDTCSSIFPLYPYLVDPAWISRFEAAGHDVERPRRRRDRRRRRGAQGIPDDVTVGFHICRGNFRSSWMCEGRSNRSPNGCSAACRTTRSSWSGTTRAVTAGSRRCATSATDAMMVMGLISSKTPELEDEGDLVRRLEGSRVVRRRDGPARDQSPVRVRERDARQRDERGRPVAQARARREASPIASGREERQRRGMNRRSSGFVTFET